MKLSELLRDVTRCRQLSGDDPEISSVVYDSRQAQPGSLFVALRGLRTSGEEFVTDALQRGAVAVASESATAYPAKVATVQVENARKALAELSWAFYGHPEKKLTILGVTGTNGKTTSGSLIQSGLNRLGWKTGLVGTLGVFYGDVAAESDRTTPESADLARYFAEMIRVGCSHAVMEATSIGVDLERTWRIPFRVVVFTNLTRDHLDYHGSEESYRNAKLRLFSEMETSSIAVINRDDPSAEYFIKAARGRVLTYGTSEGSDLQVTHIKLNRDSVEFMLRAFGQYYSMKSPIVGLFNVYNLVAASASIHALGVSLEAATELFTEVSPVKGRAERVPSNAPFTVIVDYAHTPDALEKLLASMRTLSYRRIITVIGAGGDRDRGKRPLMAAVAHRLSDLLVLTSDNPRSEDPEAILDDLCSGLPAEADYVREPDRKSAISIAIRNAGERDLVLIAGKGHETYQEIQGVRYPFDDAVIARELLLREGYDT